MRTIRIFLKLVTLGVFLQLTGNTQPFPVLGQGSGSCTGCTTTIVYINDIPCELVTCTDPNYPVCLDNGAGRCTDGTAYQSKVCRPNGVELITYLCTGGIWNLATQEVVNGNGYNERFFCDYGVNNAGCGRTEAGDLLGIPTRVREICSPLGYINEIERGACGDPPCRIPARCVITHNLHCDEPACREQSAPVCYDTGGKWVCAFDGVPIVELPKPCPAVQRSPFPRGMVGIPNSFAITSGCAGGGASKKVGFEDRQKCGKTVVAYSASVSAACAAPDMGATWTMDERDWNVGHTSDNGLVVEGSRSGIAMQHIYETSSYDKPANGPGFPNMADRQPAYQVTLRTQWLLSANFSEDLKVKKTKCYIQGTDTEVACDRTDVVIEQRTVEEIETHSIGSFVYGPFNVLGAHDPQDTFQPNYCGQLPLPVIQSQAIIEK